MLETERVIAFHDINPVHPGHILVVPRAHTPDLMATDDTDLAAALAAAKRVAAAVQAALRPDGINLHQANGPGAAQSVGHFHLHVVPRRLGDGLAMNWPLVPGDRAALAAATEAVRRALVATRG